MLELVPKLMKFVTVLMFIISLSICLFILWNRKQMLPLTTISV